MSGPAYQTLTEGQWSFVMLHGCLGALAAGRRGHPWLAGVALTVLWLKPPLLLLVLVWLLLTRHWRVAWGMVGTVIAVTMATLPWTGVGANVNWEGRQHVREDLLDPLLGSRSGLPGDGSEVGHGDSPGQRGVSTGS